MRLKSLADVSEEITAYIIIYFSSPMMETVSSSETFVISYMTTQNTTSSCTNTDYLILKVW